MSTSLLNTHPLKLPAAGDLGLLELPSASGLSAFLLPSGTLHALRHQGTLLNQSLAGPAEDGLLRLLLRTTSAEGKRGWTPLVGPHLNFQQTGRASAAWHTVTACGLVVTTVLQLHPQLSAWAWQVRVRNPGLTPQRIDLLLAQDLGLADEAAVRNNEAYVSQYIDHHPVHDAAFGWVTLSRQNQPMVGGRFPWLALACREGAVAYCTDGTQFFGADHRLSGEPAAVRLPALPSRRLQYEFALSGLQSREHELPPGASVEIVFVARYLENHPAASGPADLALLRELLPTDWIVLDARAPVAAPTSPAPLSLFINAAWQHGDEPTPADWSAWFPGPRRHEERGPGGALLSFFHAENTHVVSRAKEAAIARPHGHILRSGTFDWIDEKQFGVTCYAAGIFGAQAYLGNPSLNRLLSVVRNALNVTRASGQRVFIRHAGGPWRQLGIPSAFVLQPAEVRWIYRLGAEQIEARVRCAPELSASWLELRVTAGQPCEFLVTHQLVLGAAELESSGELQIFPEAGWIALQPGAQSLMARHQAGACFALVAGDPATLALAAGDGLLYADGVERGGPFATFLSKPGRHFDVIMLGSRAGAESLAQAVATARQQRAAPAPAAAVAATPLHGLQGQDPGVARLNEVLPWFAHNAAIHFTAPHGLEQYGGAAWGVRDVCQGSVEWLLAAGKFGIVRRILSAVFAQQYSASPKDPAVAGCWPQWFMFPPYHFIQQTHSHGDVCFWPVKALCDYVEASNDLAFLQTPLGYTDPGHFTRTGPAETLWQHCDRVVRHCESRLTPGSALINYGDGDWDDTLQPADPAMRTRMISAWTVALAYHTFRQLAEISRRADEPARADHLHQLLTRMRADFALHAMPKGIVAGFLISEPGAGFRPLLHPTEKNTGIRYRLLPMTRSMLAELFTREEALRHAEIIEQALRFTDGVRLMSEPVAYQGGTEKLFRRAETAANVGREIGLQYVHAHIRYAEAMAKLGSADRLWGALQIINPVSLDLILPGAVTRQSNVYFTSSDADFADRSEASSRWPDLRAGRVPVKGGWRLYSSGPGLYLNKLRSCLLGLRESFGDVVFDPVLPRSLDGLVAEVTLCGRPVTLNYRVVTGHHSPQQVTVNGQVVTGEPEANPYRTGGLRVSATQLAALLTPHTNRIEIKL